jgi:hypothetical protein
LFGSLRSRGWKVAFLSGKHFTGKVFAAYNQCHNYNISFVRWCRANVSQIENAPQEQALGPHAHGSRENFITPYTTMALILGAVLSFPCKADKINEFVRIACVPENGMLDIDYRQLHDSISSKPTGASDQSLTTLAKAGFHRPSGLKFTCELGEAKYAIDAQQDAASNLLCGASPAINLNITRNGSALLSNVTFGKSCSGRPSIMRITIGDGKNSWRGREMETCYATGDDMGALHCDWTGGADSVFAKRYPVDDAAIKKITTSVNQKK